MCAHSFVITAVLHHASCSLHKYSPIPSPVGPVHSLQLDRNGAVQGSRSQSRISSVATSPVGPRAPYFAQQDLEPRNTPNMICRPATPSVLWSPASCEFDPVCLGIPIHPASAALLAHIGVPCSLVVRALLQHVCGSCSPASPALICHACGHCSPDVPALLHCYTTSKASLHPRIA